MTLTNMDMLPALVQEITGVYFRHIALAGLQEAIEAFIIVGSAISKDDFIEGVSDIDFVAVLQGNASEAIVQQLSSVHKRIKDLYATDFDGIYFKGASALDYAQRSRSCIVAMGGELVPINLADMYGSCLEQARTLGIPVYGNVPAIKVSRDEVLAERARYVRSYWEPWLLQHRLPRIGGVKLLMKPALTVWAIYNLARNLYFLRKGRFLTKAEIADALLQDFAEYSKVITEAAFARKTKQHWRFSIARYKRTLGIAQKLIELFHEEYGKYLSRYGK